MLRLSRSVLSSASRRALSSSSAAATPATAGKAAGAARVEIDAPTRYMPATANGRYVIEQLSEHWRSCVAAVDFAAGDVIGTAPGIFVRGLVGRGRLEQDH
jgi:hypothetical protein